MEPYLTDLPNRRYLHRMLGGQSEFNMFHTEIGDTKILQGMIALVIFARTK